MPLSDVAQYTLPYAKIQAVDEQTYQQLLQQFSDEYVVYPEPSHHRFFIVTSGDSNHLRPQVEAAGGTITSWADLNDHEKNLASRGTEAVIADQACTCPKDSDGFSPDCPMARNFSDQGPLGHVKCCPATGRACPCLPGSLAQAYCAHDAQTGKGVLEFPAPESDE